MQSLAVSPTERNPQPAPVNPTAPSAQPAPVEPCPIKWTSDERKRCKRTEWEEEV